MHKNKKNRRKNKKSLAIVFFHDMIVGLKKLKTRMRLAGLVLRKQLPVRMAYGRQTKGE